jgi:hypothetical protein
MVKKRISAQGVDRLSYHAIIAIDSEQLCRLFNACIEHQDVPNMWLSSILVALLKPQKSPSDPESYRIIAIECCLLKMITALLIDEHLKEWMEVSRILPDSQNGFRETYRTNNNSMVLRLIPPPFMHYNH